MGYSISCGYITMGLILGSVYTKEIYKKCLRGSSGTHCVALLLHASSPKPDPDSFLIATDCEVKNRNIIGRSELDEQRRKDGKEKIPNNAIHRAKIELGYTSEVILELGGFLTIKSKFLGKRIQCIQPVSTGCINGNMSHTTGLFKIHNDDILERKTFVLKGKSVILFPLKGFLAFVAEDLSFQYLATDI